MAISIKSRVPCWQVSDFTTFLSARELTWHATGGQNRRVLRAFHDGEVLHLDDEVTIEGVTSEICGRALACWCCDRSAVSLTVRSEGSTSAADYKSSRNERTRSTWEIKDSYQDTFKLCRFFHKHVLRIKPNPTGVIAFFGQTGSRKSTFARGLIDLYLKGITAPSGQGQRRPHLLSFEDPIENFFEVRDVLPKGKYNDAVSRLRRVAQELAVDYTPRAINSDTPSLEAGLLNALRQKPTVVYVGETRTQHDWQSVLNFGGTGHLVVTTAHGGTLLESMSHLFNAAGANSPAQRSFVAGKILAVIHLRSYRPADGRAAGKEIVIPSMWRRTASGANTLVTDGLGSILPNNPNHDAKHTFDDSISSLGRLWFGQFINDGETEAPVPPSLLNRLLLDDLQGL